jgi:hypothetical protein
MFVSLATDIDDPVERLAAIAEGSRLAKAQAAVLDEDVAALWLDVAVPAVSSRAAKLMRNLHPFDHFRPPCNLVVSNVPGPPSPLWCAGHRVVAVYPIGPIWEGVGLNITALSYQGQLALGVLGSRELVPEVDRVASDLVDSASELRKAAQRVGRKPAEENH